MFNGKKLDYEAIYRLLIQWDIGIYYSDKAGMRDMIIVQRDGKFVRQLSMNDVFKMLESYAIETHDGTLDELYKSQQITQTSFYRKLPALKIQKYRDKKHSVTFFFKNKVVQVDKDGPKEYDYDKFDTGTAHIWESHLIDHNIDLKEAARYEKSNWFDFCKKAVDGGINELMRSLGYLVHNYKDPTNAKIVVYADASEQSGANGGTGKSLIAHDGNLKLRKTDYLEGKKFDPDSQFAFQTIDEYADIVVIDDVQKNFKYQYLYNAVTNDMTIERKYSSPIHLPFKLSPKFLITTNYGIINQGDSDKRRRVVIAFSDHFNIEHTVYHEYGQEFFTDWSKKEWDWFFGFYFEAARMYLNHGLADYDSYSVDRKALSGILGEEFTEYVENNIGYWLGYDRRTTSSRLYDEIPTHIRGESKEANRKQWEQVIHANNYKIERRREGGGRYFWLEKTDSSNEYEKPEQNGDTDENGLNNEKWEDGEMPF